MPNRNCTYLILLFLALLHADLRAQPNSLERVEYVMPMPAHPAFSAYDYGQVFVRVSPAANGTVDRGELMGIELMAADTVAFHFVDPAIFDETLEPSPRTGNIEPEIRLLEALVANRAPGLRLRDGDLRRSRGERCPHCPDLAEPADPGVTEKSVVITVRLRRE